MISIKIYKRGEEILVAACDEYLIGKTFEEGKYHLEVSEKFYDGERVNTDVFKKFLAEATIANLVGKETIKCAIEVGLIDPDCIIRVKGVPHAQMVKMMI